MTAIIRHASLRFPLIPCSLKLHALSFSGGCPLTNSKDGEFYRTLRDVAKFVFGEGAELFLFGSHACAFATQGSDLDIMVKSGGQYSMETKHLRMLYR